MSIITERAMKESDHSLFLFRFGFRLGENNMRASYTGILLSFNLYSCHSSHHRDLSSHKCLSAMYRAKNMTR